MRRNPLLDHMRLLLLGILVICFAQSNLVGDQPLLQNAKLTNRDVLDLISSGLTAEIVVAKIKSSECVFDTSPSALKELKSEGVPDSVILAMVAAGHSSAKSTASQENPPQNASATEDLENHVEPAARGPNGYKISYVKSEKKWKYGLRSEPYDKVSDYLVSQLVVDLDVKGAKTVAEVAAGCCLVSVELLEVTSHPAVVKKPGIDVSANVTVTDAKGKLIYSKGYRGESRTVANTWGHLINHACEDMAKNIAEDDELMRVLATGKL